MWDQLAVEKLGASYGCARSLLHRCEILSLWRLEPCAACVQQDRSSVVSDLLTSLQARRRNIEENTALCRTYAGGARCLLRLMEEREWAVRQKLERDAA